MSGSGRSPRQDPELPLFDPPERVAEAPGRLDPDLAIAEPARARPFLLEGERARVTGTALHPDCRVRFRDAPFRVRTSLGTGAAANVVVSPGRLRREWVGTSGSVEETVLVVPTLPLVVFAFAGTGGRDAEIVIEGDGALRWRAGDRSLTVAADASGATTGGPGGDLLVVARPGAPGPAWEVGAEGDALRIVAPAAHDGDGPALLLVAAGPPAMLGAALRAAGVLRGHEARAVAPEPRAGVALATGVAEIDEAFAWLATRLVLGTRWAAGRDAASAEDLLAMGLAAAALGDEEGALLCHRALARAEETAGVPSWEADLLAGHLALATGRTAEARAAAVRALVARPGEHGASDAPARAAALRALADGLRYGAPEPDLARLRAAASRLEPEGASGPGAPEDPFERLRDLLVARRAPAPPEAPGRRLPMAGAAGPGGGAPDGPPDPPVAAAEAADVWAALARDPVAGWAGWRGITGKALRNGPGPLGAWDDPGRAGAVPAAALLVLALLREVVGARPDAPVGRLLLAPRLPPHVRSFRVRGLPAGGGRVELTVARTPELERWVLEPVGGALPATCVLHARVAGEIGGVRIDGAPAEPTLAAEGGGTRIELQTPLDAPRTIEIEREDPGTGGSS